MTKEYNSIYKQYTIQDAIVSGLVFLKKIQQALSTLDESLNSGDLKEAEKQYTEIVVVS